MPTFAFVPGLFHTAQHFDRTLAALHARGHTATTVLELPNIGAGAATAAPLADAAAVRAGVAALADAGEHVVLVAHSYGGIPAQQAVRGLDVAARRAAGRSGGIARVVFVTAFAVLVGETNVSAQREFGGGPVGFVVPGTQPGTLRSNERGREVLLADLADEPAAQDAYFAGMREMSAHVATTPARDAPWDVKLPKTYVLCRRDRALVLPLQEAMLARVRDETWTVEELDCGHEPFLSNAEQMADILVRAAEGVP